MTLTKISTVLLLAAGWAVTVAAVKPAPGTTPEVRPAEARQGVSKLARFARSHWCFGGTPNLLHCSQALQKRPLPPGRLKNDPGS